MTNFSYFPTVKINVRGNSMTKGNYIYVFAKIYSVVYVFTFLSKKRFHMHKICNDHLAYACGLHQYN